MKFEDKFGIVYFVVFGLLVLGNWLFMRGLSPERKHHWYARVSLVSIGILGPFLILFPAVSGQFEFVLLVLLALAFIAYVTVAVVRVCKSCGHVAQPGNLVSAAKFCPQCGETLTRSKIFHDSAP